MELISFQGVRFRLFCLLPWAHGPAGFVRGPFSSPEPTSAPAAIPAFVQLMMMTKLMVAGVSVGSTFVFTLLDQIGSDRH